MADRDELKPCPFCGGNADPKGWASNDGRNGPECADCGATAESEEQWNQRAPVAAQAAQVPQALFWYRPFGLDGRRYEGPIHDSHIEQVRKESGSWKPLYEAPVSAQPALHAMTDEEIAKAFHDTYERLGPSFGWDTQQRCKREFDELPPENKRLMIATCKEVRALLAQSAAVELAHADAIAVDNFAAELKAKLAKSRDKGRGGWQTCDPADLSRMLREHVEKGDPRDVANFCMFLWHLNAPIAQQPAASDVRDAITQSDQFKFGRIEGLKDALNQIDHWRQTEKRSGSINAWSEYVGGVIEKMLAEALQSTPAVQANKSADVRGNVRYLIEKEDALGVSYDVVGNYGTIEQAHKALSSFHKDTNRKLRIVKETRAFVAQPDAGEKAK